MARGRVCVLTLTRDRLDYTKHCFERLRALAGHPYEHYILDQGSTDGTPRWLERYKPQGLICSKHNLGIAAGMNALLELAGTDYDVYVKFDNDCELVDEDTLAQVLDLLTDKLILSPRVQGLDSPPPVGEQQGRIGSLAQIGGIFMAVPGWVYQQYRYPADLPIWGMDDVHLCHWFQSKGGKVGYVMDLAVNHYETTQGQRRRYVDYFTRKDAEFAGR